MTPENLRSFAEVQRQLEDDQRMIAEEQKKKESIEKDKDKDQQ